MVGAAIGSEAGGILSEEDDIEVGLLVREVLSKEAEDDIGRDAGPGRVLGMAGTEKEEETSGTCEEEVLFKSIGEEVGIGLDMVKDTEPDTVVDVLNVVILETEANAGEEDLVVIVQVDVTITALESPPATPLDLSEVDVCRFKLLAKSSLSGGGWVGATEMGGLWVTGAGLSDVEDGVATELGVLTEALNFGGTAVSEASLVVVAVRTGLTKGALATVDGIVERAVATVEVAL